MKKFGISEFQQKVPNYYQLGVVISLVLSDLDRMGDNKIAGGQTVVKQVVR